MPRETAFELFAAALDDVRTRSAESNRYDLGMLRSIRRYRALFRKDGLARIALPDVGRPSPAQLDSNSGAPAAPPAMGAALGDAPGDYVLQR